MDKKLIVCNRALKWWHEETKEVMRIRKEARARFISSETTTGWEVELKGCKRMRRRKEKEMWEDVVIKTKEDVDGGTK